MTQYGCFAMSISLDMMALGETVRFLLQIGFFHVFFLFLVLYSLWVFPLVPTGFYIFHIRVHAPGDVRARD